MDYHKLYQATEIGLFTDLTLILKDDCNSISLNLHKIILYSSSSYFEKLLTSFKEKNSNNIIIEVRDAQIAYDLIMSSSSKSLCDLESRGSEKVCFAHFRRSLYGQKTNSTDYPEWKYKLELAICADYFGLQSDSMI